MARQYRINLAAPLFYLLVHCFALLCENSILQPPVVKQWANSTILQRKVVYARLTGSPNYNTVKVIKWSVRTNDSIFWPCVHGRFCGFYHFRPCVDRCFPAQAAHTKAAAFGADFV